MMLEFDTKAPFEFSLPTKIIFGAGVVGRLAGVLG